MEITERVRNRAGVIFAFAMADLSRLDAETWTRQVKNRLFAEESITDAGCRSMRSLKVWTPSSTIEISTWDSTGAAGEGSAQTSTSDPTKAEGAGSTTSYPDWAEQAPEAEGKLFGVGGAFWDNFYLATLEADTQAREEVARMVDAGVKETMFRRPKDNMTSGIEEFTEVSRTVIGVNLSPCPIVKRYVDEEGTVFSLSEVKSADAAPSEKAASESD